MCIANLVIGYQIPLNDALTLEDSVPGEDSDLVEVAFQAESDSDVGYIGKIHYSHYPEDGEKIDITQVDAIRETCDKYLNDAGISADAEKFGFWLYSEPDV